jgi:hypothetical protein
MAHATSLRYKVPLVALAAALVIGCQPSGSPAPSDSPAASASGQASAEASPTPTPGPPNIVWTDQSFAEIVTAVNVDQGQFVAVGGTSAGLASWTSSDGVAWVRHPVPAPSMQQLGLDPIFGNPTPDPAMMGRMARIGDTLISIGTFFGPIDFLRPLGWRTTDVTTWEFIESTNPFYTSGYGAMDLISSGEELVALNRSFSEFTGGTWRWTLATSWVQTTPGTGDFNTSGVNIHDAAWADDHFVAVGDRQAGPTAASWSSTDGQSWQSSPAAPALAGGIMRSVAVAPGGGFVAVGDVAGIPTAWTSADGLTWASVTLPGGGGTAVHGLVAFDSGLLAIGDAGAGTLTWTSADGTVWAAGPTLQGTVNRYQAEQGGGETIAAMGDTVVLFVTTGVDPSFQTVLWVGQIQP